MDLDEYKKMQPPPPPPPPSSGFNSITHYSVMPKFTSSFQSNFQFSDPISNAPPVHQGKHLFPIVPTSTTFSFSLPNKVTSIPTSNTFFQSSSASGKNAPDQILFDLKKSFPGSNPFAGQRMLMPAQSKFPLPQFGVPGQIVRGQSTRPSLLGSVNTCSQSTRSSASFSFVSSLRPPRAVTPVFSKTRESRVLKNHGHEKIPDESNSKDDEFGSNSSDIIPQLTSIVCKGLPVDLNNKDLLMKHFSQFGKVEKISCSRRNEQAIIQFDSHKSTEIAKKHGSKISPYHKPVPIFWCHSTKKTKELKKSPEVVSLEVDSELKAMLQGAEDHTVLSRPSDIEFPKPLPKKESKKLLSKSKKLPSEKRSSRSSKRTNTTENSSLKSLQQAAHTPEDRYALLDARDKYLRLNLKKQSDVNDAKGLVGACNDMCPERERYGRFTKKCLSIFEQKVDSRQSMDLSNLDHRLIIKEYSRSSADQEEPLPHELRPTSALQMTMDYLLCNIINRGDDVSTSEWYDFIWNRTRAIRKDITQQHLCDTSCVEIVEKCARFHIHCAAALCDEDMSVFDPKINDENLTKCLQTLKHLYQDLAEKNIQCVNEPEFRAYDILLSLKEGDTLRHVQKLRIDVRNTFQVQFAVQAALAFSSNNYLRFFKLVQQATYLNACVLHRYFNHVRMQAVQVILKAFCAPNRTEQYPAHDLWNMLKFDDISETVEFFKLLGFKVDEEFVHLDRLAFVLPISPLVSSRSAIVDGKKECSLSEVINMGRLPDNPLNTYMPYDSFDSESFLKRESYQTFDPAQKEDKPPKKLPEMVTPTESLVNETTVPPSNTRSVPLFDTRSVPLSNTRSVPLSDPSSAPLIFKDSVEPAKKPTIFVSPPPREPIREFFPEEQTFHNVKQKKQSFFLAAEKYRAIEDWNQKSKAKTLADAEKHQAYLNQAKKQEDERKQKEHLYENIFDDLVKYCISYISKSHSNYIRIEQMKYKKTICNIKKRVTENIVESILKDVASSYITDFVEEEISTIRATKLKNFCVGFSRKLVEECVVQDVENLVKEVHAEEKKLWHDELDSIKKKLSICRIRKALMLWRKASMKRRNLEACRNLFPSCPRLSIKTNQSASLANPAHCLQAQAKANHILGASLLFETIKEEIGWYPYDLRPSFEKSISLKVDFPRLAAKIYFWKLLLVYEEDTKDKAYAMFSKWLCAKFTKGVVKQDSKYKTRINSLYWLTNTAGDYIAVCVRSIAIDQQFTTTLQYMEENSLLDGTCGIFLCVPCPQNVQGTTSLFSNVVNLLKVKFSVPQVPLHCFVIGKESFKVNKWLKELGSEQLVNEHQVSTIDFSVHSFSLSQIVFDSFEWLLHHCPVFPEVTIKAVSDYVENGIVAAFNIVYNDLSHCLKKGVHQNPRCITMFWNEVNRLKSQVVTSDLLKSMSWPVPEVVNATGMGKFGFLKEMRKEPKKLEKMLMHIDLPPFVQDPNTAESVELYVHSVVLKFKKDPSILMSSIRHFLRKGNSNIPWADIIHECVQYAAMSQEFPVSINGDPLKVVYITRELEDLNLETVWERMKMTYPPLEVTAPLNTTCQEMLPKVTKRKREEITDPILCEEQVSPDPHLQRLQKKLLVEKQESEAFLIQLQKTASYNLSPKATSLLHLSPELPISAPPSANLSPSDLSAKIAEFKSSLENERRASEAFANSLKGLLI